METTEVKYSAVGRRKESVARVSLKAGSGQFIINKRPLDNYFPRETLRTLIKEPFDATQTVNKFDVSATVCGGGNSGQAGAVRLGIARALLKVDANLRSTLRSHELLTRDSRMRERKKFGQKGARKRFQWTKR
ncbi:MAG: 30S ribosomal protein S9 [Candidatus Omnitrophota bacterium]